MNGRLVELTMRFRTELIPDSTVYPFYMISDWLPATFRAFSERRREKGVKHIKLVHRIRELSCRKEANPI